jgi:hypothetical protein
MGGIRRWLAGKLDPNPVPPQLPDDVAEQLRAALPQQDTDEEPQDRRAELLDKAWGKRRGRT